MKHRPHVFVPGDWSGLHLEVSAATEAHLRKSLRLEPGAAVTYTDGAGRVGEGAWTGAAIERGVETEHARPRPTVTVAVAPPKSKDRQRFVVEKLQELGVAELLWMRTQHGQGRPPRSDRAEAWAIAALEQSRGTHLMRVGDAALADVAARDAVACAAVGDLSISDCRVSDEVLVAIGPEGGFTPEEIGSFDRIASLGDTILRTETAAIVAAARLIG